MADNQDIKIIASNTSSADEKNLNLHLTEENLREHAKHARELFNTIQDELEHREEDLKEGLSFLDMKNDTLLSYMIDVCNIILRKVRGESIEGHLSVERCVEYRLILEKIKAIDHKLAYQLNKLITLPEEAEENAEKIIVENLDINLKGIDTDSNSDSDHHSGSDCDSKSDSDSDSDKVKVKVKAPEIYKPPKLRTVVYSGEGHKGRKNHDFYRDGDDHSDRDEPLHSGTSNLERTKYEEDNYTRLPENPKKKRKFKKRRH